MSLRKKTIASLTVIVVITILLGVFINNNYLFNPILYKKDNITYGNWTWYKNPMSIEYISWDFEPTTSDSFKEVKIKDEKEINVIFKELKKSEQISEFQPENPRIFTELFIRANDIYDGCDANIVLDVRVYDDGKVAKIKNTNTYVKLTSKLTELVNKRAKETKPL